MKIHDEMSINDASLYIKGVSLKGAMERITPLYRTLLDVHASKEEMELFETILDYIFKTGDTYIVRSELRKIYAEHHNINI
jgi:hypothetical protein